MEVKISTLFLVMTPFVAEGEAQTRNPWITNPVL